MIVDITGFGWTGSGAYHDLLREYDDVSFPNREGNDWEFYLLHDVDGIADLEYKLCHKHCRVYDSDLAIRRFLHLAKSYDTQKALKYNTIFRGNFYSLCENFISNLTQIEFTSRTFDEYINPRFIEQFRYSWNQKCEILLGNKYIRHVFGNFYKRFLLKEGHLIRVSYNPTNFLQEVHNLLKSLFSYIRDDDSKVLITDQMFPADNPTSYFKYIPSQVKCIIVYRDPRDWYVLAKEIYNSSIPVPVNNVHDFIWFYKNVVISNRLKDRKDLLYVNYEDIIYNYEKTVKQIEDFVGAHSHSMKKKFLNPQISINNTQIFRLYSKYKCDISTIERELPMELFPFENYPPVVRTRNKIF